MLILASHGGTTTVCTREKFLKIQVPRLTKIGFLIHFFVMVAQPNQLFAINIRKIIALRYIIDASIKTLLEAIHEVRPNNLQKK